MWSPAHIYGFYDVLSYPWDDEQMAKKLEKPRYIHLKTGQWIMLNDVTVSDSPINYVKAKESCRKHHPTATQYVNLTLSS